jgi:hypothetical protein
MRVVFILALLAALFALTQADALAVTPAGFCPKYAALVYTTAGSNVTAQHAFFDNVFQRAALGCAAGVGAGLPCANPINTDIYPAFKGFLDVNSPVLASFASLASNTTALSTGVETFATFFGNALGCSLGTTPDAVRWSTLFGISSLSKAAFDAFNSAVVTSFASYGVSAEDSAAVLVPYLGSFGRCAGEREICAVDGCDVATNSVNAAGSQNIQFGCVLRENTRLSSLKIDSVVSENKDEIKKLAVPTMVVGSIILAILLLTTILVCIILHKVKGDGRGMRTRVG